MVARRWMVALDESGTAEKIVQWMRDFPHPGNTVVTLVHVLGPLEIPDAIGAAGRQLLLQQQEAMIDTALSWAQRILKEKFTAVEVITREGVPGQELLRLIRECEPDLVISGRGGPHQAAGFGLGSVSHRLVSYAPCSVLLVPGRVQRGGGLRVMLATDGSADAQRAARVLATLPELREIAVVSVARPLGAEKLVLDRFHDAESRKMQAKFIRHRKELAHQAIEGAMEALKGIQAPLRTRVLSGHPAQTIVRAAQREGVDLLVVGSRGLTGVKAISLGSVSRAVAQLATCPVLIVKP
ncbi:MAG: universal stress protein [Nitrospira sp.]|nr:universal stress protein [Nitrospira sp.]